MMAGWMDGMIGSRPGLHPIRSVGPDRKFHLDIDTNYINSIDTAMADGWARISMSNRPDR